MHSTRRGALALLLVTGALSSLASAQEPDPRDVRLDELERRLEAQSKQLDEQARRLQALEPAPGATPPPGAAPAAPPAAETYTWGYDDGFFVKGTIDGAPYELRPRARIQLDYRAFLPDTAPNDQFLLRRARVGFAGSFSVFGFDLEVDPGRSPNLPVADFWLQYQQFDALRVRLGHFKTPFSLDDGMTSDLYLDMAERPMVVGSGSAVSPDFLPGAMTFGALAGGAFKYWLSAQNEVDANTTASGDPLVCARLEGSAGGFTLGAAGYWDRRVGAVPAPGAAIPAQLRSYVGTTPGQFQIFAPIIVRGWTQAYELDAAFSLGPFWTQGEFVWAHQQREGVLADGSDGTALDTQGAYLTLGFMFWGPRKDSRRPHAKPFDQWELFSMDVEHRRNKRNVGAEVAVRFDWLDIDDEHGGRTFVGGAAQQPSTAPNAARVRGNGAKAIGLGFNLYPIENVKLMADWNHIRIDDIARAEKPNRSRFADEFLLRAQLEF